MILRLLTDHFAPSHKIVVSVDAKRPFCNLLGLILRKCAVPSMQGHCIYLCKGNPPRPSVPFYPEDLKNSPKKMNLKEGSYIMIKAETGGIKERKAADKIEKKEQELKAADPDAYKKLQKEKNILTRQENEVKVTLLGLDPDEDLPKEMMIQLCSPAWVFAAVTIVMTEVGGWLEKKHLAKVIPILCAAIAAAVPTYFCEREHTKRAGCLQTFVATPRIAPAAAQPNPSSTYWGVNEAERMNAVFAKLKEKFLSKSGDVLDEVFANLIAAPDLHDSELVVALSAKALFLRDTPASISSTPDTPDGEIATTEEDGKPSAEPEPAAVRNEMECFLAHTIGVHGADLDRLLLCSPPEGDRLSRYTPLNKSLTAVISEALYIVSDKPKEGSEEEGREEEVAQAWILLERHVKWIFHVCALSIECGTNVPGTLYKGMPYQSMKTILEFKEYTRGTVLNWPGFAGFSDNMKTAEKILLEGFKSATSNPFGKSDGEAKKEKDKGDKEKVKQKPKQKDDKATLLFKATKMTRMLPVSSLVAYTPPQPYLLSPFNVFEVQSTRPNTNVSENSYDVDLKYTSAWDPELAEAIKAETLRASERLLLKRREPEALLLVVLALTTGCATIAPILLERDRQLKEINLHIWGHGIVVIAAAVAAEVAAVVLEEKKELRRAEREDAETASQLREAKDKEQRARLEAEVAARKKRMEQDKAARAKEAAASEPTGGEDAEPVRALVAPPVSVAAKAKPRRKRMDLSVEELDAIKEYEARRAERRRELDTYERERRQDALDEISRATRTKQDQIEKSLKDQEEKTQELLRKNADFEQRLLSREQEMERKREQLRIETSELDERRKRMEQEQEFAVGHLTRVTDEQLKAMKEVTSENEELRKRYLQQTDEVLSLRTQVQRVPSMEEVAAQNQRIEARLDDMSRGGAASYQSRPQFAPVLAWLVGLGLGRFAEVFAKNEFDIHTMCELSDADLDHLQITALGPRRRLLWEAKALKATMEKSPFDPNLSKLTVTPESGIRGLNLKKILTDFYLKYDPVKVPQVATIFAQFQGQYDALFATLSSMYPLYFPSPYRDRTIVLLKRACPSLLPAVDVLLDLHQEREVELLGELLRAAEGVPLSLRPGVMGGVEHVGEVPQAASLGGLGTSVYGSALPLGGGGMGGGSIHHGIPFPPSEPSSRNTLLATLSKNGVANPEHFVGDISESMLLRARAEVEQGIRPRI